MAKVMAVPFSFRNKEYYSLIRLIPAEEGVAVKVTIMDGELERLLSGSNVFQYKNGRLLTEQRCGNDPAGELQSEILHVLQPCVNSFVRR